MLTNAALVCFTIDEPNDIHTPNAEIVVLCAVKRMRSSVLDHVRGVSVAYRSNANAINVFSLWVILQIEMRLVARKTLDVISD